MVNTATPKNLEFTLPSDYAAQEIVHERIVAQIHSVNATRRDEFAIRMVLEEALTNAMKHGNGLDVNKKVFVKSTLDNRIITIEIQDEGNGFSPDRLPDPTADENLGRPSGRGVLLIRSFMDEVEYNEKGNRLTMSKQLGNERPVEL